MRKANDETYSPPDDRRSRRQRPGFRDQRGQALAEFAIVVPLLLVLLVGIVEFGSAWRSYQVLTNTAREGARMAVVANQASFGEVLEDIEERLRQGGLNPDRADVEFLCEGDDDGDWEECSVTNPGESTQVRISYPYNFVFLRPIANWVSDGGEFAGSVTMATGIVMRNE